MPIPLVALAAGGLLLTKGKKMGNIVNVSKGPLANGIKGAGLGAFVNYLDGKFLGGTLQKLKVGSNQKGMNLSAADAVTVFLLRGKGGFSMKGNSLMETATIIGGKKIGEFTGAIDPIELGNGPAGPEISYSSMRGGLNA